MFTGAGQEEDDGVHVLAVALYSIMKEEKYNQRKEKFRDFLIRNIRSGKLSAGRIKPLYEAFYARNIKGPRTPSPQTRQPSANKAGLQFSRRPRP
jgi:hypothetical protein